MESARLTTAAIASPFLDDAQSVLPRVFVHYPEGLFRRNSKPCWYRASRWPLVRGFGNFDTQCQNTILSRDSSYDNILFGISTLKVRRADLFWKFDQFFWLGLYHGMIVGGPRKGTNRDSIRESWKLLRIRCRGDWSRILKVDDKCVVGAIINYTNQACWFSD